MKIALCYESVLPERGGCETYLVDLCRRLVADGHQVHLYACRWDAAALPQEVICHRLAVARSPRFLRPWLFGAACERALADGGHDVSIGFDKTWGQDVLYPQGGLHSASARHNLLKFRGPIQRQLARCLKFFDPAAWSFAALEKRQYLRRPRPIIIVNSHMVAGHFQQYYGVLPSELRIVRSAIDPGRFDGSGRLRVRADWRQRLGIGPDKSVGLFVAMNYRLKGLEPLLHAVSLARRQREFCLALVGSPRIAAYERLARRLGIETSVKFLGPRRDVHECFFGSDFLVHPTFYDPCSLVVLEALACGLPVITSRYNGAAELLSPPREGFVIGNPHDHDELAAAIVRLLDPQVSGPCARAARQAGLNWTFDDHYRQLLEVLTEAASRRRAA